MRGPEGPPIHPCPGGPDEEVAGMRSSAPEQKRSPTPRGSRSACGCLSTCPLPRVDIGNLNRARELTGSLRLGSRCTKTVVAHASGVS
jgi:hypothetical protein